MKKGKLIICLAVVAVLAVMGAYFVKGHGFVSERTYKGYTVSETPNEATYATPNASGINQLETIELPDLPDARFYSAFCDDSMDGQFIILECLDRSSHGDNVRNYSINRVSREEFSRFFNENISIEAKADFNVESIFDAAEIGPQLILSCLTRKEGITHEETTALGRSYISAVRFADYEVIDFPGAKEYGGSTLYRSGIESPHGANAYEYGQHFDDNGLDLAITDSEIVRLITTKELLSGDNSVCNEYAFKNTFIAIVDATVLCNENTGKYGDVAWIPEEGRKNRVRFMMTCELDIYEYEGRPEIDTDYFEDFLGVYSFKPVD